MDKNKKKIVVVVVSILTIGCIITAGCLFAVGYHMNKQLSAANQRVSEIESEASAANERAEAQATRASELEGQLSAANERAEAQAARANELEDEKRTQTRTISRLEDEKEELTESGNRIRGLFRPELNDALPALPEALGDWSSFTAETSAQLFEEMTRNVERRYDNDEPTRQYRRYAFEILEQADRGEERNRLRSVFVQITRSPAFREVAWAAMQPTAQEFLQSRPIEGRVELRANLVHVRDVYLADLTRYTADQEFYHALETENCGAYPHISEVSCNIYRFYDYSPVDAEIDRETRRLEAFVFRRMREGVDPASLTWVINQIIAEIDASAS